MLFAATLRAKPGITEIRARMRAAHDAYWGPLMDRIWLAGPLLSDEGERIGQIMIVNAENQDDAHALVSNDPFAVHGCFEPFAMTAFRPSIRDGMPA
jgi:uncharacterized protein